MLTTSCLRHKNTLKYCLSVLALTGFLAALPMLVRAQSVYPSKPIRLVVPFTPGGVTDTSARLIAEQLSKRMGQQVIVDNRPGASGNIGTQQVAAAEPDGYTLLLGFDGTLVINPHVFDKVPFNTTRDFAPIGKIGDAILILVAHPGVSATNLKDVVALSKSQPAGLSYGTSGTGGTPHIAGELLKLRTGANLVHIPYKGGGQAMTDVLGGNIPLVFTAVAGAQSHVKSGKLRAIAVSSAQRSKSLPDVPTFMESGLNGLSDFEINSWVGLLAPAKTPKPIIDRLNTELVYVLNDLDVRDKLNVMGIGAAPDSSAKFSEDIKRDLARYGQIVKAAGIKAE